MSSNCSQDSAPWGLQLKEADREASWGSQLVDRMKAAARGASLLVYVGKRAARRLISGDLSCFAS